MGAARALRLVACIGSARCCLPRTRRARADVARCARRGRRGRRRRRIAGHAKVDGVDRSLRRRAHRRRPRSSRAPGRVSRRSFDGSGRRRSTSWRCATSGRAASASASTPDSSRRRSAWRFSRIGPTSTRSSRSTRRCICRFRATRPARRRRSCWRRRIRSARKVTVSGAQVGRARGHHRQLAGSRPAVLRRQQAAAHGQRRRRRRRHAAHRSAPRRRVRAAAATPTRREVRDKSARRSRTRRSRRSKASGRFGYTRIAGEFLWTQRETGRRRCDGRWRLDRDHADAVSPRVFAAVALRRSVDRVDEQSPTAPTGTSRTGGSRRRSGFRLTPDVTLRASYMTRKGYVVGFWDDQFLASIVWAREVQVIESSRSRSQPSSRRSRPRRCSACCGCCRAGSRRESAGRRRRRRPACRSRPAL